MGDALARIRCPNAEVVLQCRYESPKDHESPPTLINAPGVDDAFTRGLRTWARQLKALRLINVVIAPGVFYPYTSDGEEAASEWPHLERLEIEYAAVTPHGTWMLERNPGDSPVEQVELPWAVEYIEGNDQDDFHGVLLVPDNDDGGFRTVPVAAEMDQLYRSAARAARRMPALQRLYLVTFDMAFKWYPTHHGFLYEYDAIRGVAYAHWGSSPGYTPPEDVVALWREVAEEVRGCQLEVLIDADEV